MIDAGVPRRCKGRARSSIAELPMFTGVVLATAQAGCISGHA